MEDCETEGSRSSGGERLRVTKLIIASLLTRRSVCWNFGSDAKALKFRGISRTSDTDLL